MFRKTVARHSIRERPRLGGLGEASLVRALPLLLLLVPLASASSRAAPVRLPLAKADLTLADRAAFRRALGWSDECESAFDATDGGYGGIEVDALAPGRYLIGVVCARGAYQGYRVYFFYDEKRLPPAARALTFEIRESPDERSLVRTTARELWGLPTFDRRTRQLRILNKFRGPGDCGTLATYRFVEGVPELAELRAKLACDGKGAEAPERWPPVPPH
ncbi:MAG TPA: DUF1176 domain-containing protein [Thermoanaerobaculia bacterium]|nr:DUF1176 domain-containing protein [Thermoanaerobaculia bacterium]